MSENDVTLWFKCDVEDCEEMATEWVLWTVDNEDQEDTVGYLCEHHSREVADRGHAELISEDEAEALSGTEDEVLSDLAEAMAEWWDAMEDPEPVVARIIVQPKNCPLGYNFNKTNCAGCDEFDGVELSRDIELTAKVKCAARYRNG